MCGAAMLRPQRLTTRSTSWFEMVQQGQLCGARCRRFSTVARMCAGELSLLSSSKLYAMCRRPGCVYSVTVAVESSDEISPSATTSGYSSSTRRMSSRKGSISGCVLLRSEEHTSELQSRRDLVCRLLLEKKKIKT